MQTPDYSNKLGGPGAENKDAIEALPDWQRHYVRSGQWALAQAQEYNAAMGGQAGGGKPELNRGALNRLAAEVNGPSYTKARQANNKGLRGWGKANRAATQQRAAQEAPGGTE